VAVDAGLGRVDGRVVDRPGLGRARDCTAKRHRHRVARDRLDLVIAVEREFRTRNAEGQVEVAGGENVPIDIADHLAAVGLAGRSKDRQTGHPFDLDFAAGLDRDERLGVAGAGDYNLGGVALDGPVGEICVSQFREGIVTDVEGAAGDAFLAGDSEIPGHVEAVPIDAGIFAEAVDH